MSVVTSDLVWTFVVTCFLIELTPGPNMAYLAMLSMTEGRRAGFAMVAGIALGLLVIGVLTAFGLSAVIASSPLLYGTLRWAGVLYLLWLAWEGWTESERSPSVTDGRALDATYFNRGLITNLLNPKAAVFYVAMLPTFVDPANTVLAQTITLSVIYVAVATVVHASLVVLAGSIEPFLRDPVRSRIVRRVLSVALAGVAVWFAISTAPQR